MPALPWTKGTTVDPDHECVIMASRLPLTSYRHIPAFLAATMKIRRQLAGAEGLVGYMLDAQLFGKTFWTLSAWQSRAALDAFSNADPHRARIDRIRPHMRPTTFVFWTANASELPPAWPDARRRVEEQAAKEAD
jgi:heme-degrading monooxygenase HmoA